MIICDAVVEMHLIYVENFSKPIILSHSFHKKMERNERKQERFSFTFLY